jgi:hypothetical protein
VRLRGRSSDAVLLSFLPAPADQLPAWKRFKANPP